MYDEEIDQIDHFSNSQLSFHLSESCWFDIMILEIQIIIAQVSLDPSKNLIQTVILGHQQSFLPLSFYYEIKEH